MDNFAGMKDTKYNYEYDGVKILTGFHEIADVDTAKLDGYLTLACIEGRLEMDINGTREHLDTYEILVLPPHTRINNLTGSENVRCDLAVISLDAAKKLLQNNIEDWNRCIYIHKRNHIVTTEESRGRLLQQVGLLAYWIQHKEVLYSANMLQMNFGGLLFVLLGMMMDQAPQSDESAIIGQHKIIFVQFMHLLTSQHVKHQLVDDYSQKLCISSNYLNKICKEISGRTPLQWIREYTEADIRYYLLNTNMSVKEICNELGFPNLSFFGRFCRRAFGMSPNEFRNKVKKVNG